MMYYHAKLGSTHIMLPNFRVTKCECVIKNIYLIQSDKFLSFILPQDRYNINTEIISITTSILFSRHIHVKLITCGS
jgi:hypothetical protein